MAIDTTGYITVAEAAKRLGLSIEQVRRKLRDGKLKGHRIGNQWFVDASKLIDSQGGSEPLIPAEIFVEVDRIRNRIAEQNPGYVFDAVEMVKTVREDH